MRRITIGRINPQIRKISLFVFSLFLICSVGIGLFYLVDISKYIYPESKNIKIKPHIDFSPESRAYCDTSPILVDFYWSATNNPDRGDEIHAFYGEKLTREFGDLQILDNQFLYPVIDYWIPFDNSRHFFIDVKKVFFDAWLDNYGSTTYIYGVETRIYVGVFPKTNNSCPDKG
jgi:hypothetical protein